MKKTLAALAFAALAFAALAFAALAFAAFAAIALTTRGAHACPYADTRDQAIAITDTATVISNFKADTAGRKLTDAQLADKYQIMAQIAADPAVACEAENRAEDLREQAAMDARVAEAKATE
jgi:hypothetical protein